MSDWGPAAMVGTGLAVGGGIGVTDVVGGGMVDVVGGGAGTAEVATNGGIGVADVASAAAGGTGAGLLGFFSDIGGFLAAALSHALGFLGQVAVGLLIGGSIVAGGFLLLVLLAVLIEVRAHRGEQVPLPPETTGELRGISAPTPRTLRWVRVLLPNDEGSAWVAEVASCLAEAQNESEQRRHIRSYRRAAPQLIWTSWVVHLRSSRSRTLS